MLGLIQEVLCAEYRKVPKKGEAGGGELVKFGYMLNVERKTLNN